MGLLIEVGVVALAVWLTWRGLSQHRRNVTNAIRRAERAAEEARTQTLVQDPKTGVYRPAERHK